MKTLLLVSGLLVLASGSSCLDSQTVLPGQLGSITDAVVGPCKPYKSTEGTHQCLFLTDTYHTVVKVFDVTDNQFVLSPIGYFPLVIKVGQLSNKIAAIGDRIFTLDPATKAIYEIPSSFISPLLRNPIPVGFSATDFALMNDAQGEIVALVSQTNSGITTITEIALEGQALPSPYSPTVAVDSFQINPTGTYLLVASGSQLLVVGLTGHAPVSSSVTLPNDTKIVSMTSDSTRVLLGLSNKTLVVVDLAGAKIEGTSSTLDANAGAVYLPTSLPGTPSTCCNGEANWVSALLMNGTLQYWPYSAGTFGTVKTKVSIDLVLTTGVGSFTLTNPTKLLGAQVQNQGQDGLSCERRLFLVYSGAIFNTCEGNSNIKRVDQMEY